MAREARFGTIGGEDLYRRLATGEPFVLLDVRAPEEFEKGHIPGSILIPLQEIDARWTEVPRGDFPLAVVCEYGVRSASACRFLAERDVPGLFNLEGGIEAWPGPVAQGIEGNGRSAGRLSPEPFLVESFHLLPMGLALDIAMGEGRNAIYLASRGFDVDGVDSDPSAVKRARSAARRLGAPIRAVVGNVEDGTHIIPVDAYDVISVFDYVHRPLFTDIREGLKAGGVVVFQAPLQGTSGAASPADPARLLAPGELKRVFDDWEILRLREEVEPSPNLSSSRLVAGIVARKPAA